MYREVMVMKILICRHMRLVQIRNTTAPAEIIPEVVYTKKQVVTKNFCA
jgi:hypothetical protein